MTEKIFHNDVRVKTNLVVSNGTPSISLQENSGNPKLIISPPAPGKSVNIDIDGMVVGTAFGDSTYAYDCTVAGVAGTNGNIVTHDANGKLLDSGINLSTLSQQASGGGLVENIDFFLAAGSNSTIVLRANCKYPFTLNDITDETSSGTITGNVRKNGVSVGGLDALSFTSTPTTVTATSNNSFVADDKLDIVFTSNSSSLNVAGSIKITRG